MNNYRRYVILIMLTLTALTIGVISLLSPRGRTQAIQPFVLSASTDPAGFARALPPADIVFPRDFGPHPEFQTEWWYYTGNLSTADNRRFGYQLTIFRRALLPPDQTQARSSDLATNQIYLGHLAISDINDGTHHAFERYARGAGGIAGARAQPYHVWLEDWQVVEVTAGEYRLQAAQDGYAVDLYLTDIKGPVLQGIDGYSQKGPDPGNASYYYSQTRLETDGTLQIEDQVFSVAGYSWKDHEYSTSALSGGQVGWDWFALQFSDFTELKVFHIRLEDGTVDRYSSGSFVSPDGSVTPLGDADFTIQSSGEWTSNESGATYPAGWTIRVPDLDMQVQVTPLIADQELTVSYAYWEGAVRIEGTRAGLPIDGYGYAELTGYAQSMAGEF